MTSLRVLWLVAGGANISAENVRCVIMRSVGGAGG